MYDAEPVPAFDGCGVVGFDIDDTVVSRLGAGGGGGRNLLVTLCGCNGGRCWFWVADDGASGVVSDGGNGRCCDFILF